MVAAASDGDHVGGICGHAGLAIVIVAPRNERPILPQRHAVGMTSGQRNDIRHSGRTVALALVVHTREAWDDTFELLAADGVPDRTIIHCFTGGPQEARRCLDLGASLSFSGVVTFKNAGDVREAAALCPFDRLLVETDSPFLTPVPHRGTPNEPARVPLVGAAIAQVKGVGTAEVAAVTTVNARRAFGC